MSFPIVDLIIGSTTLAPLQRLPSAAFTANLRKVINGQRAQSGTFHTNTLYKVYTVQISGIAQTLLAELRYEYERDDLIDLYMIVDRIERLNATGATTNLVLSRRMRVDDIGIYPTVEYPIGTQIASSSISALTNTSSAGRITLTFTPTAGTQNVLVRYYPILNGTITEFASSYDWTNDEESYNLVFEESPS